MRLWASSLLWYIIPKSLNTRVNVITFLLCRHNPGVTVAGSYTNGLRHSLRTMCEMMPAWTRP